MKSSIKSSLLLLLTAVIWGFAFVAQDFGADHLDPFTFGGIRFVMGAVSLIPVILILEREADDKERMKTTVLSGILAGVILFAAATFQQYGIAITHDAGKGGFITGLYIVLVPIIGIFLGRKTTLLTWISAVVAIAGLFFLCLGGNKAIGIGDILFLIGAVFWSLHILTIDHFSHRMYPLRFAQTQFLTCGVISLVCMVLFEQPTMSEVKEAVIPLLYTGLLSVGVAYTLQIIGQRDADPTFAAIIMSTESVFSALGVMIVKHQFMTVREYFGCALIFAAIIMSQLDPRVLIGKLKSARKKAASSPDEQEK